MATNKFMFATGIENSYPTIILPDGKIHRVDEMEKTGHYKHWQQDFELVKEHGTFGFGKSGVDEFIGSIKFSLPTWQSIPSIWVLAMRGT